MHQRNFSPRQMFAEIAKRHVPTCRFSGTDHHSFLQWKEHTLPQVLATLGDNPETCPPNPRLLAQWEHDSLFKQRWLIDIHPYASTTFLINYPADPALLDNRQLPAILCWNGHDAQGKENIMGNHTLLGYGHMMAKAGFITYAIDWMGYGDRSEESPRNGQSRQGEGKDWCNLYYLDATMLGMTSLSINITHAKLATDFACTLPGIDANNLGVMGASGGGTMALWTALCDERIKATNIICYSDLWADFGFVRHNYCGMQVAPGLFKLVDLPDLQGLLAPLPLLVEIGAYDECFPVGPAMDCYRQVEHIYNTAKAQENLELDLFSGPHGWGGNKSHTFFAKHLNLSTE